MKLMDTKVVITSMATFFTVGAMYGVPVLTVTSPSDGDYVGQSAQIKYQVENATVQIKVKVTITQDGNPANQVVFEDTNVPGLENKVIGTINWNPGKNFPQDVYHLLVEAFEGNSTIPFQVENLSVNLDPFEPKILDLSPVNGSFFGGSLLITAKTDENPADVKEWKILVDNNLIPNGTQSGIDTIAVIWSPPGSEEEGEKTIKISVTDLADNKTERDIKVRFDKSNPVIKIKYPNSATKVKANSLVTVLIDIVDNFFDNTTGDFSVTVDGVSVMLTHLDGTPIKKVPRGSYKAKGGQGDTAEWIGRFKVKDLPKDFKIVVTAVDRAGNAADPQEVILKIGS